jgi:hypothetical protein
MKISLPFARLDAITLRMIAEEFEAVARLARSEAHERELAEARRKARGAALRAWREGQRPALAEQRAAIRRALISTGCLDAAARAAGVSQRTAQRARARLLDGA